MEKIQIKHSTVPPTGIYEKCRDRFGADFRKGVVFTVGDTIHAQKWPLPPDLYQHEATHVEQQSNFEGGWRAWWDLYLENPYFRYTQEIEAYQNQYRYFIKIHHDRNKRNLFLHMLTQQVMLMYGFEEIQLTEKQVRLDIKNER